MDLSINNDIVDGVIHKHHYKWNIAQARPMSASDVSRSLQSLVSTTHRSYSHLTFFNIVITHVLTTKTEISLTAVVNESKHSVEYYYCK